VAIFTLAIGMALGSPGFAQNSTNASYEKLVNEGLSEFDRGNWTEALALFNEAYKNQPNARTLRAIGMTLFELRRYVKAIDHLKRAKDDNRKPLSAELRQSVQELIERSHRFVGTVKLETLPTDASVLLDGTKTAEREILLDAGEHQFTAKADGYQPVTVTVDVRASETRSVSLILSSMGTTSTDTVEKSKQEPKPEAQRERTAERVTSPWGNVLPWILIASGGSVVVGGIVTGAIARNDFDTLESKCPNDVCASNLKNTKDRGQRLQTLTNVLWITGGVAIGAGIVLLIVGNSISEHSDVAIAPIYSADSFGLIVHGAL